MKANKPDIPFITDKGTEAKLVFDKSEYRAYKMSGGKWEQMLLGAAQPDNLIEYIKRRF